MGRRAQGCEALLGYLSGGVDVILVPFLTAHQSDVGDVLYWVGQGQQHLALLCAHTQWDSNTEVD